MGKKKLPEELIMRTVGVRIPVETERAILYIAQRDKAKPSEVLRRLIEMGLVIDRQFQGQSATAA
jgi:hypothetical protein